MGVIALNGPRAGAVVACIEPSSTAVAASAVPTDWELVEQARRQREAGFAVGPDPRGSDAGAFATLFERHAKAVFSYLLRLTGDPALAEDLIQETFLAAYRHLGDLRPERTAGGRASTLRPWLLRVSRNLAFSHFRRTPGQARLDSGARARRLDGDTASDPLQDDSAVGPEEEVLRSETAAEVRRAVARLSPRYREPVLLHYAADLTYGEIAFTLGLPLGTVATRLRRGLAALGRELTGKQPASREHPGGEPLPGRKPRAAGLVYSRRVPR